MTTEPAPASPAPQQPSTMPNPFAGIPLGDYVRDGAALVLLLVSLALPWNLGSTVGTRGATDHLEVVLITVISVLSLVLTYLVRAEVFGSALTAGRGALIRGAANVPYALLVMVYLVIDASKGSDEWYFSGGIGVAAALGLSGAILAGMPRQSETASLAAWQVTTMRLGTVALGALWAVMSFLNLILSWVAYKDSAGTRIATLVISVLLVFALVAGSTLGVLVKSASARLALIAGAGALLGATVIEWWTDWDLSGVGMESLHVPALGILPLLTLAAMASSPLVKSGMKAVTPARRDSGAAAWLMLVIAAYAGATVIMTILGIVGDEYESTGMAVGYIVTLILITAAALVAATFVKQSFSGSALIAMGAMGAIILIGIVALVLANKFASITGFDLTVHIGLPLASIMLLGLSMRGDSTPDGAPATAAAAPAATPEPTPAAPAPETQPAPPAPKKASKAKVAQHPRAAEAANPETSAHALHEIATTIPELRPAVAANPSAYPELLEWMGQLHEPAVDKALAARPKDA